MADLNDEDLILELKDAYSLFDRVGDGKASADEIPNILRAVGLNPMKEEVEKLKKDLGKKKRLEFEEFLAIYAAHSKKRPARRDDFIEALKIFDKDSTGEIGAGQLRQVLTSLGDRMSEVQADDVISLAEKNGMVDYGKLIETILSNKWTEGSDHPWSSPVWTHLWFIPNSVMFNFLPNSAMGNINALVAMLP